MKITLQMVERVGSAYVPGGIIVQVDRADLVLWDVAKVPVLWDDEAMMTEAYLIDGDYFVKVTGDSE